MTINDELLNKLEKLSTIKIATEKRDETKQQLSEIVAFVEILNELDLNSVDNAAFGATPFRADTPKNTPVIEEIFANAPKSENHFFIVPKIIE